jgi:GMP synthase-like glutamine amidotransferase
MKPVLVIEQEERLAGQGVLGERLRASGLPYRTVRAWVHDVADVDVADVSAIVPLGGNVSAWQEEEYPFLRHERELLEQAVEADVPVLGICLGAQLLVRALGGEVGPGTGPEIGWLEIELAEAAAGDPVFGHPTGCTTVFQWHLDAFDVPPGGVRLASSRQYENQAFRAGSAWGVQFHPEVDYRQFAIWIANHRDYAVHFGIDERALHAEVEAGSDDPGSHAFRAGMFDRFLEFVRARAG